jgi:ATP-dependent exoDNAse (exonuclease V) alpha subunit
VFDVIEATPDRLREASRQRPFIDCWKLTLGPVHRAQHLDVADWIETEPFGRRTQQAGIKRRLQLNVQRPRTNSTPAGDEKVERFGWTFAAGDKVMQIENDHDKEVYNGDIGAINRVDPEVGEIAVTFDGCAVTYGFGELDMLVPAYAATIHKSQGSEYPAVIIPLLTQHYAMLQRNLLYTGVTRGKRLGGGTEEGCRQLAEWLRAEALTLSGSRSSPRLAGRAKR